MFEISADKHYTIINQRLCIITIQFILCSTRKSDIDLDFPGSLPFYKG